VSGATRVMPKKLPVPPKIIAKVIEIAAEPECTTVQLAELIQKDPTLTAQVLRAVNAAHYGLRRSIESVPHATAFMGISAVRNLVLCIGVQQLSHGEASPDFPLDRFWEMSVQRAAASACLARRLGVGQPDDFFTTGLCQDIGILASLAVNPELGADYAAQLDAPADERLNHELQSGSNHAEIGAALLREWRLPAPMTNVIEHHHNPDAADPVVRVHCMIALAAEAIADLLNCRNKAAAMEYVGERLVELELPPALLREIVDEVIDSANEAASMLQLRMGVQPTFEEIAALASDALVTLSMDGPATPEHVGRALLDQQSRAVELEQHNEELQRLAATDALTGLSNRRLLDDALEREFARAERRGTELSVLMIDVDHFKQFNDRNGHRAGDRVLQALAAVLRRATRKMDICARFGGEEFAVVLPCTGEEPARMVAERIRAQVEAEKVHWDGEELSISISVGCITRPGSAGPGAAEEAIQAADRALYEAKNSGRNRVC